MARIPPALWLLGLAVGVSWALKEEGAVAAGHRTARAAQAQVIPVDGRPLPASAPGVARMGPAPVAASRL